MTNLLPTLPEHKLEQMISKAVSLPQMAAPAAGARILPFRLNKAFVAGFAGGLAAAAAVVLAVYVPTPPTPAPVSVAQAPTAWESAVRYAFSAPAEQPQTTSEPTTEELLLLELLEDLG